ncbi:MAG: hypothetical protein ACOC0P_07935, partial [Planctomycetota bacterium]
MAITTSLARRYFIRRIVFGVLFIGFGLYGAWHGFVTYPAERNAYLDYQELQNLSYARSALEDAGGSLTPAEQVFVLVAVSKGL